MTQRVLLAEDDPNVSRLLRLLLERRGYEVVEADSGESALRRYREGDFGIVLTHLNMGEMSGLDLIRRIRAHGQRGYTYVILISGAGELPGLDDQLWSGPDDFLAKPVEAEALYARLKVAGRIARMQAEFISEQQRLEKVYQELNEVHQESQRQLKAAARVQQELLPAAGLSIPGFRLCWRLTPCVELAGDILNCQRIDNEHTAFYVLDVSGHGVSAALLSVQISRVLSPVLSDGGVLKQRLTEPPWYRLAEPLEVLHQLNGMFQASKEIGQYFTMSASGRGRASIWHRLEPKRSGESHLLQGQSHRAPPQGTVRHARGRPPARRAAVDLFRRPH